MTGIIGHVINRSDRVEKVLRTKQMDSCHNLMM